MGTTLATNALLERKGRSHGLITARGWEDAWKIGDGRRPELFQLTIKKWQPLYSQVLAIPGRMNALGQEIEPLDEALSRAALLSLQEAGLSSLAIVLPHAYRNPNHEIQLGQWATEMGFSHLSLSHQVIPRIGFLGRGDTTAADAYLTPLLHDYLEQLKKALPGSRVLLMHSAGGLSLPENFRGPGAVLSGPAGGAAASAALARRQGLKAFVAYDMGGTSTDVCRGTASEGVGLRHSGVVAGTRLWAPRIDIQTVAAGGGSLCCIRAGRLEVGPESAGAYPGPLCYGARLQDSELREERTKAAATQSDPLMSPHLASNPSADPQKGMPDPSLLERQLALESHRTPEPHPNSSQEFMPSDGESGLTVTDINLYLGYLRPENFPFPLHRKPVELALQAMANRVPDATPLSLALGFRAIVDASMASAVEALTTSSGHDPADHDLIVFGGAGGQHACGLARRLGMRRAVIPPLAGIFSAFGMGQITCQFHGESPLPLGTHPDEAKTPAKTKPNTHPNTASNTKDDPSISDSSSLPTPIATIRKMLQEDLQRQALDAGFDAPELQFTFSLDIRLVGAEAALTLVEMNSGTRASRSNSEKVGSQDLSQNRSQNWAQDFASEYQRQFGFPPPSQKIEAIRARMHCQAGSPWDGPWEFLTGEIKDRKEERGNDDKGNVDPQKPFTWPTCCRADLEPGKKIIGPLLVFDSTGTVAVEPGFTVERDSEGNLWLEAEGKIAKPRVEGPAAITLFNAAFMTIAEAMGRTLQRMAHSTNVKDRLDFSCAVFDNQGRLIANAPHIPVHLGAMGESVRHLLKVHSDLRPGDGFLTNHPAAGGSHLPDLTLIEPVFLPGRKIPDFFVANRAHHADVGGQQPGSMPAHSQTLAEEGIQASAILLLRDGQFDEEAFAKVFLSGPYPVRQPDQNRADLAAQAAANKIGAHRLINLCQEQGVDRVLSLLPELFRNAANQVEKALQRIGDGVYAFTDALDDGTPIAVRWEICQGKAIIDFEGTGPEHAGNLNAPQGVVRSCVLYVLRCLVQENIPLNEGCFEPVDIRIPKGTLLNPSSEKAVAGGNVETSQRVVDVLLGALGVAAASQGTMNNVVFGNSNFGVYETLPGGSGATAWGIGADAVHTHMTNTRLTDPEVLESRHPLRLETCVLRKSSGGQGQHRGGDGLVREYRFLEAVEINLLSQRRILSPYGLNGGGQGARGVQFRIHVDGREEALPEICSYSAQVNERLRIETPGGGGWGHP
jgi:5-oxoprolinase (ATP-hydrolysing)